MRESFSLGRISGIRIGVNWSVLVIVALLAYGLAVGQLPAAAPRRPEVQYAVAAVITAAAYIASLLAHELAHSLVARRNRLEVEGITLWLLGGVSRLQGEIPDPGAEIRVAGVGPLVSLILGGVFLILAWLVHASGVQGVVVAALAWLGAALLGWFLISAATAENQQAVLQSRLRTVAVRQIMTANPVTVPASATVAQFLSDYLPAHRHSAFPVVADGQTVGLVTLHRINQVPAGERGQTTLREAACPLSQVARATPDEPVANVLPRLSACSEGRALVFADGQLAGIVSPSDMNRALQWLSSDSGPFASSRR
jgi:CBS domain-containing protein